MPLTSFITSTFLQVANCSGGCCYCNTPTKSISQWTRTWTHLQKKCELKWLAPSLILSPHLDWWTFHHPAWTQKLPSQWLQPKITKDNAIVSHNWHFPSPTQSFIFAHWRLHQTPARTTRKLRMYSSVLTPNHAFGTFWTWNLSSVLKPYTPQPGLGNEYWCMILIADAELDTS